MNKTIAQHLSDHIQAMQNCYSKGKTEPDGWYYKHKNKVLFCVAYHGYNYLSNFKIDIEASTPQKLVFTVDYHHMNENGFWDGWTNHKITVKPEFNGFDIRITGEDRNHIKDVLYENVNSFLNEKINEEEEHRLFENYGEKIVSDYTSM